MGMLSNVAYLILFAHNAQMGQNNNGKPNVTVDCFITRVAHASTGTSPIDIRQTADASSA